MKGKGKNKMKLVQGIIYTRDMERMSNFSSTAQAGLVALTACNCDYAL
jgi:hypothetical protein